MTRADPVTAAAANRVTGAATSAAPWTIAVTEIAVTAATAANAPIVAAAATGATTATITAATTGAPMTADKARDEDRIPDRWQGT